MRERYERCIKQDALGSRDWIDADQLTRDRGTCNKHISIARQCDFSRKTAHGDALLRSRGRMNFEDAAMTRVDIQVRDKEIAVGAEGGQAK